ncbi:MAG: DUF4292 domain-containing protein [Cyclobacteriaceae bacterium]|jgi:hypothetical protein|nr:DUF4292 domain-containing protein [Flammeovirgaceae bacterium]
MRVLALICATSISFLAGCGKKITPTVPTPPKTISIEEIDFGYLHGKAKMVFKDDQREREVKANIRIRKDSVIWMTFSVVGVQGGKALINQDSITIVSTVDKEYYVFTYAELSKRFNFEINYGVIQSALLGNPIIAKRPEDKIDQEGTFDVLLQRAGSVAVKNLINSTTRKLEQVELSETTSTNSLKVTYSNFQPVGERLFPYNGIISIFYKTPNGIVNNTISFEYNKAEVGDKELKFPFNIPKRYDRR